MARSIWIALVVLGTATAHAQTGPRTGGPAPGDFSGTRATIDLSLTGNAARGLVDRDLIIGRGAMTLWAGDWGLFVQPYYVYGDVGGNKTDDERYLRTLLFRTFQKPMFLYGVTALDHSLRRRIDRRALLGGGVGATLVNKPGLTFLVAVGLLYETGDYDGNKLMDGTMVPPQTRRLGRTSLRLYGRYRVLHDHLNLLHDIYLIPAMRDLDDLRAMASLVGEIPIIGGFAARVQVDATYEEFIVTGTKHDDIALTFGISFKGDWTVRKPSSDLSPP